MFVKAFHAAQKINSNKTAQNSATTYFLEHKFDGNPFLWRPYRRETEEAIRSDVGADGYDYMFTDWPTDDDDNI